MTFVGVQPEPRRLPLVAAICLLLGASLSAGCGNYLFLYSKPHVDETGPWRIHEECGYGGCASEVGFLTGEGIKIRIEAFNYYGGESFSIHVWFIAHKDNAFTIDPSKAYVVYPDGS